jgi:hypothetical protein
MRFASIARAIFSGSLARHMATVFHHDVVVIGERVTPDCVIRTYECHSASKALRALAMSDWIQCDSATYVSESCLRVKSVLVWPRVCRAVHAYTLFATPGDAVVRADDRWTVDYHGSSLKSRIICGHMRKSEQAAFDEFVKCVRAGTGSGTTGDPQ